MNLDSRPLALPFQPQTKGANGVFWVEREEEGGECLETVIAYSSPATPAKIAAEKNVCGEIGAESFQLTANNLAALRALLAQLCLPQLEAAPARRSPHR